jgi:hypothetical protein
VLYAATAGRFLTLKVKADLDALLTDCRSDVREKVLRAATGLMSQLDGRQKSLF